MNSRCPYTNLVKIELGTGDVSVNFVSDVNEVPYVFFTNLKKPMKIGTSDIPNDNKDYTSERVSLKITSLESLKVLRDAFDKVELILKGE